MDTAAKIKVFRRFRRLFNDIIDQLPARRLFFVKGLSAAAFVVILAVSAAFLAAADDSGLLQVDFLDVGQGDAILIRTPDGLSVLVDGGPNSAVLRALDQVLPWWQRRIDIMVLTHPHDDHAAGLNAVLDNYQVSRAVSSGAVHSSPTYLAWLKRLQEAEIKLDIIKEITTLDLGGGASLDLIWPQTDLSGQSADNLNNTSLAARLNFGEIRFLLLGDIEAAVEKALLADGQDLRAQVVKVGHHGSDTSSTDEFVQALGPDYAVVSVGAGNSFGHPSLRVLRRFQRQNAQVLRTDQHGTVSFTTDGRELWLKP